GDVVGPASAVNNNFATYDGTTGKLIKDSGSKASDFATASHNHSGTYEPVISSGTTGQYWRGDKSWQTLDKSAVGLGSVENTALSTWGGSANISTVGTVTSGSFPAANLTLTDVTTNDVSTSAHGLAPKLPNDSSKYLNGVGAWAVPSGGSGDKKRYYNVGTAAHVNPADSETRYMGVTMETPSTTPLAHTVTAVEAGTITVANITWIVIGAVGTNENVSIYVRVNNTTDYLIATVGSTDTRREFNSTSLSISLSAGDYWAIKMVYPAWATNPANVAISGTIVFTAS
ncbi:MAG: hypothetical protein HGA78_07785, partial [Nitrospirales bacterium]|nr:hypothetical protein [Nitrospirales bacterium]